MRNTRVPLSGLREASVAALCVKLMRNVHRLSDYLEHAKCCVLEECAVGNMVIVCGVC